VHTGFYWGRLCEREHLEDVGVLGTIIQGPAEIPDDLVTQL